MPASNYPNGFTSGVTIRGLPITLTNTGKVFWVYNGTALQGGQRGGSDGNKGTYESPFSTLNYAVTQCVAGRGDIIVVKAGHAEALSSATACVMSIAGVAIIGLGVGNSRPTFTLDTANTATVAVSADNVSIQNCIFIANFLSIAACFTLTTAKAFTLSNCLFKDTSGVLDFLNIVKSTGAANTVDALSVTDCQWNSLGTTSMGSLVLSANTIDGLTISRNRTVQVSTVDASIAAVISSGILTNAEVSDNKCYRKNTATSAGSLINVGGTTSTGFVSGNYVQTLTTSADALFTTTVGLAAFNNYVTGAVGASGFLIPAVDS